MNLSCKISYFFLSTLIFSSVWGATITVNNANDSGPGSLRTALSAASPGDMINFNPILSGSTITLSSASLPAITGNLTITGLTSAGSPAITVNGNNQFAVFFVHSGNAKISNLNIVNARSQGGQGGQGVTGGGGAMGAGGGLFIDQNASATIQNVSFNTNSAVGGNGGVGNLGVVLLGFSPFAAGGGAGGLADGNQSINNGRGGNGSTSPSNNVGGAGGGGGDRGGSPGVDNTTGTNNGGAGGNGAQGGGTGGNGGMGVVGAGGGGGGGGEGFPGGANGTSGGNGVGVVGGSGGSGNVGNGGGGGGGTGATGSGGGNGGFRTNAGGGGGGGGFSAAVTGRAGGNGGFGAGGGGAGGVGAASGGGGGFGGGNGGNTSGVVGDQGRGGGGGAGFGGAIFVSDSGGSLIVDDCSFSGNSVAGGAGNTGGGNGSALGADIFLMSGSVINFNNSSSVTIPNPINANPGSGGGIIKTGSGTLFLNGANTYTGATNIQSGIVRLNGSVLGDVNVNSGQFGGNNTVGGNLTNNGIVSPTSVITVNGNYSQTSNGSLVNEIDALGNTDLLHALGTASLNGNLTIIADIGSYTPGTLYPFLSAVGGVSGTFSSVTLLGNPITFQILYGSNLVQLLILAPPPPPPLSARNNAGKVAQYLNTLSGEPSLANLLTVLRSLDQNSLQQALDSMQPSLFGSLTLTEENSALLVASSVLHRLKQLHMGCCNQSSCCVENECVTWLEAVQEENQSYYTKDVRYSENINEVILGVDRLFNQNCIMGIAGSYSTSHVDMHRNQGNASGVNYYGLLYASFFSDELFLDVTLLRGKINYRAKRVMSFSTIDYLASHHHHGHIAGVTLNVGKTIPIKKSTLQPFLKFNYLTVHENSFSEHGASPVNLFVKGRNSKLGRLELGFNFSFCCNTSCGELVPFAKLGWIYEYRMEGKHMQARFIGSPGSFTVLTATPTRSLFSPAIGLSLLGFQDQFSLSAQYELEFNDRFLENNLSLQLAMKF